MSESLQRLEVRREQQKDHHDGQHQPAPEPVEHLLHRHDLAAQRDVHALRWGAELGKRRREPAT